MAVECDVFNYPDPQRLASWREGEPGCGMGRKVCSGCELREGAWAVRAVRRVRCISGVFSWKSGLEMPAAPGNNAGCNERIGS